MRVFEAEQFGVKPIRSEQPVNAVLAQRPCYVNCKYSP